MLYAKWNIWQINFNCVFVFALATLYSYILFLYWNRIGILTNHLLVATYFLSCFCIPVSNAVVEWVCSQNKPTSVFKMWKGCDFECVQDRYQCCVIFACFLSCVLGIFKSPVATPAYGLLGPSPSLRLRFI